MIVGLLYARGAYECEDVIPAAIYLYRPTGYEGYRENLVAASWYRAIGANYKSPGVCVFGKG